MLTLLTAILFVLVAGCTLLLGLYWDARRVRALDRLAAPERRRARVIPSGVRLWRGLVSRLGAALPLSPRALPLLKRRLVSAGWRDPEAPGYFQGARSVLAVLFGLAALALAWRSGSETANLLMLVGAGIALGFMAPSQYLSWRIRRRRHAIEKGLPNALDLMVICVESGLGIDQTILQVARELQQAHPEISDEFTVMNLEMRAGGGRHEALHNLAARCGVEEVKKLVAVLVQTDRFGTSIGQSLRGHADYLRSMARQKAEERASKLAVKLVFPIFFCVLPSLFVVTLAPALTHLVRDLFPAIEKM